MRIDCRVTGVLREKRAQDDKLQLVRMKLQRETSVVGDEPIERLFFSRPLGEGALRKRLKVLLMDFR